MDRGETHVESKLTEVCFFVIYKMCYGGISCEFLFVQKLFLGSGSCSEEMSSLFGVTV